ncbi:MAG: glycosyltransferase family 2 protein [Kiritimatiellae bacterium]|nr:glycosyltransferase family 2 protein [Kiritimatiellia bacterium]
MVEDVAVLIPAYQPDAALAELVGELRERFAHVVVVDDGSTAGADVFSAVRPRVDALLVHERNRGKGAALRTGFAWILENLPCAKGVVTADADGQHKTADICRVAAEVPSCRGGLVLGVRRFTGRVPLRSRFGNFWARVFFWILTGLSVGDTQTGLRGIPRDLLGRMLEIGGDRYEYEMRMLVDARRHARRPLQIPIETVYAEGNKSSHFRPLRDSLLTQLALVRARFGL